MLAVLAVLLSVAASAQTGPTVLVTPFANLSQRAADDWIGVGIGETLTNDLQRTGLLVLGGDGTSIADWLIEGGYHRQGGLVRVTVRVVDGSTGKVGYRTRVDGGFAALLELQDDVAAAVTGWLRSAPGGAAPVAAPEPTEAPVPTTRERSVTGVLTLEGNETPARSGAGIEQTATTPRSPSGGDFAAAPVPVRPSITMMRTADPPAIDGRLDDSVWESATHITDFLQIAPVEGAPGSEDTEVWMAYDSDHLYFAFYAHYSDPSTMRVNRAEREGIRGDDRMSVLFDPFLDQQRAYQFEVNGYGVQADSIVNADGSTGFSRFSSSASATRGSSGPRRSGGSGLSSSGQFGIRGDRSWNTLFDTSGRVVADGWVAEMRIPFKSLRYPSRGAFEEHRWGFQITRVIRDKSEAVSWSPISRGVAGQITQFGQLEGLSDLSTSRNLEFFPEVTGFRLGSLDRAGDFVDNGAEGEVGLGVKYGLTPNLTADVTFNPDFSQIESDRPQIETNQRFSLFFPEQRPFFLEGQEIFQTATPLTLVHTRTILDPRFGGKLTGKVGQTTLGIVVADDAAAGRLEDSTNPRFGSTAQTIIGRARHDFYSESYLGAIMTAREFGQDYNRVAGVDGRFRLGRTHRVSFLAVGSETRDATLGSLSGPAFEADFSKQGRNLSYNVAYSSIDPEFQTLTGFLPRVNLRQTSGTVGYRWWPESTLVTWGPSVTYLRLYDHAGVLQDEQIQGLARFSFRNNVAVTGFVNRDLERFNEVDFQKTGYGFFGVLSGRLLSIYGGYNWGDGILYSDNPYVGSSKQANFNFRLQPTTRLRTDFTMITSDFVDPAGGAEVFDVKIFRSRTSYQFTDRLFLRHIAEHDTQATTLGNNLLVTYRINAGTVVFVGYDDRFQDGNRIDDALFPSRMLRRTNRAFFGKLSYLFRY